MINDINVTPMVDVMLVLLIIFMVITPMLANRGPSIDLAPTQNPKAMQDASREDAVVVAVTRDGRVYLGTQQMPASALTQEVQARIATRLDKTVYVKSDARARYRDVAEAVNNIRDAGVSNIGLLTEKQQQR